MGTEVDHLGSRPLRAMEGKEHRIALTKFNERALHQIPMPSLHDHRDTVILTYDITGLYTTCMKL